MAAMMWVVCGSGSTTTRAGYHRASSLVAAGLRIGTKVSAVLVVPCPSDQARKHLQVPYGQTNDGGVATCVGPSSVPFSRHFLWHLSVSTSTGTYMVFGKKGGLY